MKTHKSVMMRRKTFRNDRGMKQEQFIANLAFLASSSHEWKQKQRSYPDDIEEFDQGPRCGRH
jgi:hypothetical protein